MKCHEPDEPVTRWQIKQARKHAKEKEFHRKKQSNIEFAF